MSASADNPLAPALKAVSRVLSYPGPELQAAADEVARVLAARPELTGEERTALGRFLDWLGGADLYEVQAEYVETFDRGKQVALYLFEHVYGESRDRGPAMVELREAYREQGLEIDCDELPDFLPLFLEFCAELTEDHARAWLEEIGPILQQLHVRLMERESRFALPLRVLLLVADLEPAPEDMVRAAEGEERDDTPAAHDRVWMEAPVTFGPDQGGAGCGGGQGGRSRLVQWMDRS